MSRKEFKLVMGMLTLRRIQSRATVYTASSSATPAAAAALFSTAEVNSNIFSKFHSSTYYPTTSDTSTSGIHPNEIVAYFREWFMSRKIPLFDRVFQILRNHDEYSMDTALSQLNLPISEALILDMLDYQKTDVLSCLKLFDWAGRQRGFYHTRLTFNAIFRILSKTKLRSLLLEYLQNYGNGLNHKVRYVNVLVIGYALAGKPETSLQLFGRMRFQGLDLDALSYHVLINALVEEDHFDAAEAMIQQIRMRGFQNEATHSAVIKSYCKKKELERAEAYLRDLVGFKESQLSGTAVSTFVDYLCQDNQFERAAMFVEEFRVKGLALMEHGYAAWIRNLVRVGKLDGALEFLKDKKAVDGYVPDLFRYNMLICRLLRENRLEDVYDLLDDMKSNGIEPDNVTMNAILCFLCKAGRLDIAMGLYDSREECGLSVNCMSYNYLINTLLGDGSVDKAYPLLRNSIEQGYLPGSKTLTLVADALCREGKLDKMKELVLFALDRNIAPGSFICQFISALCKVSRVEEGYLVHDLLSRMNRPSQFGTYVNLISAFSKSNRGDMATKLLLEMQDNGFRPRRKLVREVICCLCQANDAEKGFFQLLEVQLDRHPSSSSDICNLFIYGAGYAKKPEFAMRVYEMMSRRGIKHDSRTDNLVLSCYLKNGNISSALQLFHDLSSIKNSRKLRHTMIIGLCKAKKPEYASQILESMRSVKLIPTNECYEELVKLYCDLGQYGRAIDMVNDMVQIGRPVSSFIGNVFLLHALKGMTLYEAWLYASHKKSLTPASWMLGHLIGVFSGCDERIHDDEELEKMIFQCFPLDTYTYNMLLRRSFIKGIDHAHRFFDRLSINGPKLNRWTYNIIVHGLAKHGRFSEARIWMEKMHQKGFDLTEATKTIL